MTTDDKHGQSKTWDALNARGLAAKREAVRELELRADGRRATPALMPLMRQGLWFTRASAARIFGKIGDGDAVPLLFELTQDGNHTVGAAALDSLLAIGHQRGSIRLAHALHRMAPADRSARLDDMQGRDPALGERLRRFLRSDDLMSIEDPSKLNDDSVAVRANEEGVEWEVLTGPPPPKPRAGDGGSGDA